MSSMVCLNDFLFFLIITFIYLSKISHLAISSIISVIVGFFQMFYLDSHVIWNKDIFVCCFPLCVPFISFSCYMARASSTVLSRTGERKPCLSPHLTRKAFSFSWLNMILAIGIVMFSQEERILPLLLDYYYKWMLDGIKFFFLFICPFTSDVSNLCLFSFLNYLD